MQSNASSKLVVPGCWSLRYSTLETLPTCQHPNRYPALHSEHSRLDVFHLGLFRVVFDFTCDESVRTLIEGRPPIDQVTHTKNCKACRSNRGELGIAR